jgi:hypothetical protein
MAKLNSRKKKEIISRDQILLTARSFHAEVIVVTTRLNPELTSTHHIMTGIFNEARIMIGKLLLVFSDQLFSFS